MPAIAVTALAFFSTTTPSFGQASDARLRSGLEGLPIRTITIHGLENMDEDVVRRRLQLTVDKPYHVTTARRDERVITGLMTFWSVRIHAAGVPAGPNPRTVEVHIHIVERFAWFAAPQITWSPEEEWSYGLYGGHLNLARRGHRLYLSGLTGGVRYLMVSLHNPWNGPNHESFEIDVSNVRIRNNLYDLKESGERLSLKLGRWFGRTGRGQIGLLYRRVEGTYPWYAAFPGLHFHDRLHMFWFFLGRDTSDPWGYPRIGQTVGVRLEQNGGLLGGDLSGGAVRVSISRRDRISGNWILAGLVTHDSRWGDIPFWRLLTLGGANSLRGYPLGNYLVTRRWEITGELQWYAVPMHIVPMGILGDQIVGISLSLFVDAGAGSGVLRSLEPQPWSDRTPTLASGGVGCYFHNALFGTIRIEMAWPEHGPRQFIFGLGTKF